MDFSDALVHLKAGARVAREGWAEQSLAYYPPGWLALRLQNDGAAARFITWAPSQLDLLADDWRVVEPPVLADAMKAAA